MYNKNSDGGERLSHGIVSSATFCQSRNPPNPGFTP